MVRRPLRFVPPSALLLLTVLALAGCMNERRLESDIARAMAQGNYDEARRMVYRYLSVDSDPFKANARMVFIDARESRDYLPHVTVADSVAWARDRDLVRVEATMRNDGSKGIRFYEAVVSFLDTNRKVVDTASGSFSDSVPPGASRAFEVVRRSPPSFRYVTARVEDIRVQ